MPALCSNIIGALGTYTNKCSFYNHDIFFWFSEKPSDDRRWTAHDVELALYSFHFAKRLKPELLNTKSDTCSSETSSKDDDSDSEDSDYEKPPTKKHRKK